MPTRQGEKEREKQDEVGWKTRGTRKRSDEERSCGARWGGDVQRSRAETREHDGTQMPIGRQVPTEGEVTVAICLVGLVTKKRSPLGRRCPADVRCPSRAK
jgi:hypothetical protein